MGIHGLWKLLQPFELDITTIGDWARLASSRNGCTLPSTIAVDASIWIEQLRAVAGRSTSADVLATTGTRRGTAILDARNNNNNNNAASSSAVRGVDEAELRTILGGFIRRTLKLLDQGVLPVFVFDGPAPALKAAEQMRRRQQRERAQEAQVKHLAERLVDTSAAAGTLVSRTTGAAVVVAQKRKPKAKKALSDQEQHAGSGDALSVSARTVFDVDGCSQQDENKVDDNNAREQVKKDCDDDDDVWILSQPTKTSTVDDKQTAPIVLAPRRRTKHSTVAATTVDEAAMFLAQLSGGRGGTNENNNSNSMLPEEQLQEQERNKKRMHALQRRRSSALDRFSLSSSSSSSTTASFAAAADLLHEASKDSIGSFLRRASGVSASSAMMMTASASGYVFPERTGGATTTTTDPNISFSVPGKSFLGSRAVLERTTANATAAGAVLKQKKRLQRRRYSDDDDDEDDFNNSKSSDCSDVVILSDGRHRNNGKKEGSRSLSRDDKENDDGNDSSSSSSSDSLDATTVASSSSSDDSVLMYSQDSSDILLSSSDPSSDDEDDEGDDEQDTDDVLILSQRGGKQLLTMNHKNNKTKKTDVVVIEDSPAAQNRATSAPVVCLNDDDDDDDDGVRMLSTTGNIMNLASATTTSAAAAAPSSTRATATNFNNNNSTNPTRSEAAFRDPSRSTMPELVREIGRVLDLLGVPFLVSDGEAEVLCAALSRVGAVGGVLTEDSDCFAFGATSVARNSFSAETNKRPFVSKSKKTKNSNTDQHQKDPGFRSDNNSNNAPAAAVTTVTAVSAEHIGIQCVFASDLDRAGLTREMVIAVALLAGSDYCSGVPHMGQKKLLEILSTYACGAVGFHATRKTNDNDNDSGISGSSSSSRSFSSHQKALLPVQLWLKDVFSNFLHEAIHMNAGGRPHQQQSQANQQRLSAELDRLLTVLPERPASDRSRSNNNVGDDNDDDDDDDELLVRRAFWRPMCISRWRPSSASLTTEQRLFFFSSSLSSVANVVRSLLRIDAVDEYLSAPARCPLPATITWKTAGACDVARVKAYAATNLFWGEQEIRYVGLERVVKQCKERASQRNAAANFFFNHAAARRKRVEDENGKQPQRGDQRAQKEDDDDEDPFATLLRDGCIDKSNDAASANNLRNQFVEDPSLFLEWRRSDPRKTTGAAKFAAPVTQQQQQQHVKKDSKLPKSIPYLLRRLALLAEEDRD